MAKGKKKIKGESQLTRDLERLKDLKRKKAPWMSIYQRLAEVYLTRSADFSHETTPGEFLQETVFDNTPQYAAFVAASVFYSMLLPDAARTFRLRPARRLAKVPGAEEYFRRVTTKLHEAMDKPEAGLSSIMMSYFLDQVVFGISGIAVFPGPTADLPLAYEAWDAKSMYVAENAQGFVDTVYIVVMRTVRQLLQEYGEENVSAKVREFAKNKKYGEKIEILKIVEPKDPEKGKEGVASMKYRSAHIDILNRKVMREGGFEEMPGSIARFIKRSDEVQGRSSGMVGLPSAGSLNALSEAVLVATEKNLDPPLMVSDNARLGGGVIDTSASGINVVNMAGRLGNERPIEALFTVGEMQSSEKLLERLVNMLMQAFFLDRLLDLNNSTQMTAFETSVRNRLRGESTGAIFGRQITEGINPMINRSFNVMNRSGHFGLINEGLGFEAAQKWAEITGEAEMEPPDAVKQAFAAGLPIYEIEYISPAQRFIQAEKLQGIFTASDALMALAQVFPTITDGIDPDKLREDIYKYSGAPINSLRTDDETKKVREANAKQQQAAATVETAQAAAEISGKVAAGRAALGTIAP